MVKYGVINKVTSKTEYWYEGSRQKSLGPPYNNTIIYEQYVIASGNDPKGYYWNGLSVMYNNSWVDPNALTQKQLDVSRYRNRASAKDNIMAELAASNMERVRNGTWTVPDIISLTQDAELKSVLDDINTLSFELAMSKLQAATTPLLTQPIKDEWLALISNHLYL